MLQHLLVMAGCSAFHMKHPEYDAENLDRGIVFDGKTALVNRGHPVVSLFDAWCEQRGETSLSARQDSDFVLSAVRVHLMLFQLRWKLTQFCTCYDGSRPRSSV